MMVSSQRKKILVLGAAGQLAKTLIRVFDEAGYECTGLDRRRLDVSRKTELLEALDRFDADVVINGSAYNHVDKAQEEPEVCRAVNTEAVGVMAEWCARRKKFLIHFSTDFVFDGEKRMPYEETDAPRPLNVYGLTKWWGEQKISESGCAHLVFRLSWVFGEGQNNFLVKLHRWAESNKVLRIVNDEISVPTYTVDAAQAVKEIYERGCQGLFHLCQAGQTSRYEWAREYSRLIQWPVTIEPISRSQFKAPARRPAYSVLSTKKLEQVLGRPMRSWQEALTDYCASVPSVA